jgi:uncharacterized damage-inducible protein DinB
MTDDQSTEPWLRGTLGDTPAVLRAVLHALQATEEDLVSRCGSLTNEELNARPLGLPSVAFHLKHIAGSLDRLLTYAEECDLSDQQIQVLESESNPAVATDDVLRELTAALHTAADRVRLTNPEDLEHPRSIGRRRLPTTLGGLLVHVADHTQRHVGQAITTAWIVAAKQ